MDQGACDFDFEWHLVVVKALLEDVPVDVFVESRRIRFSAVGDQEVSRVGTSGRPDEEVADVVSSAFAAGQPVVHVFLRDGVEGQAAFFGPGEEAGRAVNAGAGPFDDVFCGPSCAGASPQAGQDTPADVGAQDGVELGVLGQDESQAQLDSSEMFVALGKTAGPYCPTKRSPGDTVPGAPWSCGAPTASTVAGDACHEGVDEFLQGRDLLPQVTVDDSRQVRAVDGRDVLTDCFECFLEVHALLTRT
ncbi:hypothetical protein ABZ471_47805 [Streptomyces sp. NPDC005728]|uniref:hypothetical protein n=1 Tax=Streptomyces sp. NPDC005728 TaxID=3157054 RepID=UPI0033DA49FB